MITRRIVAAVVGVLLCLGSASVATADVNALAAPTCTSWTTYYSYTSTAYVVHVPSAGYNTGRVECAMYQGNINDGVKVLQRGLVYCSGYNLSTDGDYGPATRNAVRNLQHRMNAAYGAGLQEDGLYGPATNDWVQFPLWTWPGNARTSWCEHGPTV